MYIDYKIYILLADIEIENKTYEYSLIESHAETCFWRKFFAEVTELKIQNSYENRKWTTI